jgi:methionyl aminopeptidase
MTDVTVFDLGKVNTQAIETAFLNANVGTHLKVLDLTACAVIKQAGFEPAFLNYHGFPGNCCISVNDQLVHGVGGDYVLQDGDVLTIDCGVQHGDIIVDSADTRVVGTVAPATQKLMNDGQEILAVCMDQVRDGVSLYDIMRAGYNLSLQKGVHIISDYGGHTIEPGKLHGIFIPHAPERRKAEAEQQRDIMNWRRTKLRAGQIICLEPVVTEEQTAIILEEDGWTTRSANGKLSVHYEHCMLITEDGYEVIC